MPVGSDGNRASTLLAASEIRNVLIAVGDACRSKQVEATVAKRDCIYMVIFYRPCRPSPTHLPAGVQAPYTPLGLLRQVSHGT